MTNLAQLKHPDPMHLKAAAGWIQLGDYDSANDELENIRAEWRAHPDVLELRWLIYSHHEQWDAVSGYHFSDCENGSGSSLGLGYTKPYRYVVLSGGGFENAKALLLEAAKLFPDRVTQSNTTWRATAPNWGNWMPLKSICISRTSLGMPSRSSLWRWMMRI